MVSRPFGLRLETVLGLLERLLQVRPEQLRLLEADAEPEESRRDALALPAPAAFHHAGHAAERGRVDDRARRGLDAARRLAVGHVEGDQAAEARVAHRPDRWGLGEPVWSNSTCRSPQRSSAWKVRPVP